jgi:putative ABC transport system permease protein
VRYYLQSLRDIHLHSDLTGTLRQMATSNTSISFRYRNFHLLIACINFMNLSTARSANRAKEVGIRKVVGSDREQLIRQFLAESIFLSLIALLLALVFVELVMPQFNRLAEKQLQSFYLGNWPLLVALATITLLVGITAGSYPAFVLSAFKPVSVLQGKLRAGAKSQRLRSTLVVFQFAASVILIFGTMIVKKQLQYIQNRNIGFNKEQVIILHDAYAVDTKLEAFKNEALRHPQIVSCTVSGNLPVTSDRNDMPFWPEGKRSTNEDAVSMQIWSVDTDYVKTLEWRLWRAGISLPPLAQIRRVFCSTKKRRRHSALKIRSAKKFMC